MKKRYSIKPQPVGTEKGLCADLARKLGLPEPMGILLWQRGLKSVEDAQKFLYPRLADIPDPFALGGMREAVELIFQAIASRQEIVIHGDYDVDGISALVLLCRFLVELGARTRHVLPHRLEDGYGLSNRIIEELAASLSMPSLLITVDCGIADHEEVALARKLGFRVIVTDHHEPGQRLPDADAIVNPRLEQKGPFAEPLVSGVGVAFFLAMGLRSAAVQRGVWSRDNAPNLKEYLDLVALGTVADVMPLKGLNRTLVRAGLEILSAKKRPGIKALCDVSGLGKGAVTAEDIGYRLAPRINAAGRIGEPGIAVDLLMAARENQAMELANRLQEVNEARKALEQETLQEVRCLARARLQEGAMGLVLWDEQWHAGIVGILAARIQDEFQVPVLVGTKDTRECLYRFSGRSTADINLCSILAECAGHLVSYGGHAMAAGLCVADNELEAFAAAFARAVQARMPAGPLARPLPEIDSLVLDQAVLTRRFAWALEMLGPFGEANREPVLLLEGQRLAHVRLIRNHLAFKLKTGQGMVRGIGFNMAGLEDIAAGPVDLAFSLRRSVFAGRERLEIYASGIFPAH